MPIRQIKYPSGAESVDILHLTDIHAGPRAYKDQDNKDNIPGADRGKMLDRLGLYLRELPKPPDYVVISGDMTISGDRKGMEEVLAWIGKGIGDRTLPPADHIIVTPGNHDVTRMTDPKGKSESRYDVFFDVFGKGFPHAFLPGHDPETPLPSLKAGSNLIGGISTKKALGKVELVKSWPFLLDLQKKLLIYAFNSSMACGTYLPLDEDLEKRLNVLEGLQPPAPAMADEIRKRYRSSRLVDAPLVGDDQILAFRKTIKHLKESLGEIYGHLTKVATLHHHISHLWRQQMEAKSFEAIIDAAQVKQALVECQFDLVLHGHKHHNHVSLDSQVIPISRNQSLNPICIVSGGTTSANPRMGDRPTFKIISLKGTHKPRVDAIIKEVPLIDGSPRDVIEKESNIYQIPLTADLPNIHDLSQLKSELDEFVFQKAAGNRLKAKGAVINRKGQTLLPVSDSGIISQGYNYKFYAVISVGNIRTFVDVFLAERPLGFRQKARIHWMLNDVKALNAKRSANNVLLVVASLEPTHFSRSVEPGEVADSINELKKLFEPAIRNGLLEIKVCNVAQKDVDQLLKRKPESLE